jgi:3-methyladenine DNA glycosylase AlkD
MDKKIVLNEIQNSIRSLADTEKAEHYQRFFKTGKGEYGDGDVFLGIRVPEVRKLSKEFKDISLRILSELLKSKFHEERQLALFILVLKCKNKKMNDSTKATIYNLYLNSTKYINNWDLVDASAEHVVGAYLINRNKNKLYKLAKSESLWERRISIMSTFHFIKNNEFEYTLKIAEMLLADKEDLIHKAVGWMLREIGNRNLNTEEIFLKHHYKIIPRTMLRYAIEKFPEGKRQKYLKSLI